jgi:hypothetical protein
MTAVVLLKALCDLGFYLTFAGFFAALWGADPSFLLAAALVQALSFAASFLLRRGKARFLPLAGLILWAVFPGAGLPEAAVLLPSAAYLARLAAKGLYFPDWSRQTEIFSLFCKIFFPFVLAALACGASETVTAAAIPAGSLTLVTSVLLTRSLRHDPEVCCQPRYQLLNLAAVAGTALAAFLLSTPIFLRACREVLQALYQLLLVPILSLLGYGMIWLMAAVLWLLSRISIGSPPEEDLFAGLQEAAEPLVQQGSADPPEYFRAILLLGIAAAFFLLRAVFRYLSRWNTSVLASQGEGESRRGLPPSQGGAEDREPDPSVRRVRAQYRRFLRLCRKEGISLAPGNTSLDLARNSREALGEEVFPLREIYIGARYGGKASPGDVARARRLCSRLRRDRRKPPDP